jgi:hypothetical protein
MEAIHAGQPFRTVLGDLELTPNQGWGLTETDDEWSTALESALMATRRDVSSMGPTPPMVRAASVASVGAPAHQEGATIYLVTRT